MSISKPLVLNELNEIDLGENRLVNDEWDVEILADEEGVFLYVDEDNLAYDESAESDLHIYVVDDAHVGIVDEWVVEARDEALETQASMTHLELDLKTTIDVNGIIYHIYIMYSAD